MCGIFGSTRTGTPGGGAGDGRLHDLPRDAPLQIVRDDDRRRARRMLLDLAEDAPLDVVGDLGVGLVVDARHLLVPVGDDADLGRRRPAGVADERRGDAGFAAGVRQRRGRLVHAGDGDERRLAAERGDVVRDVGRAAHPEHLVIERDDRHRRLGRDAGDAADDELVEHGVADDEDAGAARGAGDPPRPIRRDGRQQHDGRGVPPRTAA